MLMNILLEYLRKLIRSTLEYIFVKRGSDKLFTNHPKKEEISRTASDTSVDHLCLNIEDEK